MPCVICLENKRWYQDIRELKCNHRFHINCISKWSEKNRYCPLCRIEILPQKPISIDQIYLSYKRGVVKETLSRAGIEN